MKEKKQAFAKAAIVVVTLALVGAVGYFAVKQFVPAGKDTTEASGTVSSSNEVSPNASDEIKLDPESGYPLDKSGKVVYPNLDDSAKDYIIKSGEAIQFHSAGEMDKFISITIDGNKVDERYYTLESGSTIVIPTANLMDRLVVGTHTVVINFENGYTTYTLTIATSKEEAAKEVSEAAHEETSSDDADEETSETVEESSKTETSSTETSTPEESSSSPQTSTPQNNNSSTQTSTPSEESTSSTKEESSTQTSRPQESNSSTQTSTPAESSSQTSTPQNNNSSTQNSSTESSTCNHAWDSRLVTIHHDAEYFDEPVYGTKQGIIQEAWNEVVGWDPYCMASDGVKFYVKDYGSTAAALDACAGYAAANNRSYSSGADPIYEHHDAVYGEVTDYDNIVGYEKIEMVPAWDEETYEYYCTKCGHIYEL